MNVTVLRITPPPPPTTVKSVTLELTPVEARVLFALGNFNAKIAQAIARTIAETYPSGPLSATRDEITSTLLGAYMALDGAGVRNGFAK